MDTILRDELLEEVLRGLPPRSTFSPSTADVSLVSKRWLRLYRSLLWARLFAVIYPAVLFFGITFAANV
ncbi:hypothetical protein C3L33_02009, partial [Rhododendron williamsianum]